MIKTLLFDFGDIFLTLDKSATFKALKSIGLKKFSTEMLAQNELYEIGRLSSVEFLAYYQKQFPNASEEILKNAWNSILIELPEHRLAFLQQLANKNKYQLILLSNTNHLHISWVQEHVHTYEVFKNCFDAFYLSHEINFRKPDASIYEFVLQKHQLTPNEVLFIDDTPENTTAAKKMGIHTWNLDPATDDITELFDKNPDLF